MVSMIFGHELHQMKDDPEASAKGPIKEVLEQFPELGHPNIQWYLREACFRIGLELKFVSKLIVLKTFHII